MSDYQNKRSSWVLVGNPNAGKTALFNALTGSRQKVANYPGITVERKEGDINLGDDKSITLLDLPGTYGLDAKTPDEEVTKKVLLGEFNEEVAGIIVVIDACQIRRGLAFFKELKELGFPLVIALNMMDLAKKRGLKLDVLALSEKLGVAIIPTVAVKNEGIIQLKKMLSQIPARDLNKIQWRPASITEVEQRYNDIDSLLASIAYEEVGPPKTSEKIDRLVLHPLGGFLFLMVILFILFQALFSWSEKPMEWIEWGVGIVGTTVAQWIPSGPFQSLWLDGIVAGVGAMLVFLPQILILFFFIILLEDTGYMARAAFMMDRVMGRVGLHGRAFVPLLSGHACAIPAIMSTRTIENPRHRLLTIMMIPLTTCSARLPVYALLIAAFIPNEQIWFLNLQGLTLMGLYLGGISSALLIAFVFQKTKLKGPHPALLMELPTYKVPSLKNIGLGLWQRGMVFLKNAGTIIMALSILIWFFSSYPKPPEGSSEPALNYSFAGKLGQVIEPLVKPLGYDWRIATSLIPSFAAREVMVSALSTVYSISEEGDVHEELSSLIKRDWSLATGLSVMVWFMFAPQCLATFAVIRKETGSLRWTLVIFFMNLALAYLASMGIYQLASHWVK